MATNEFVGFVLRGRKSNKFAGCKEQAIACLRAKNAPECRRVGPRPGSLPSHSPGLVNLANPEIWQTDRPGGVAEEGAANKGPALVF